MRIAVDTNILVRAIVEDDPAQARVAQKTLLDAELVVLTLPTLCELVWVLARTYRIPREGIVRVLRGLMEGENVVTNAPAVEAGLALLEAGGDFADGVIAHEGRRLGADTFVSFDREAVQLVARQGGLAHLAG